MERFRPLVRMGLVSLPLLTGACSSGNNLGIEASDPSCVLLCALTRSLSGESAKPPPVPEKTAAPLATHRSGRQRSARTILKRPHRGQVAVARPHVSTQPRSVQAAIPKPVRLPPVAATLRAEPPPASPPSARGAPTIPGSAAIVPSTIQGQ